MIKQLFFLVFCCVLLPLFGQENISWNATFDVKEKVVKFSANLKAGWHIYSQNNPIEAGPVPTTFEFLPSKYYTLVGNTNEPAPILKYEDTFGADVLYFEKSVTFTQKINVKQSGTLECVVNFMLCNDEMCLPPVDQTFIIPIKN
jgi:thiol:disulfide interchange protein DsbD